MYYKMFVDVLQIACLDCHFNYGVTVVQPYAELFAYVSQIVCLCCYLWWSL